MKVEPGMGRAVQEQVRFPRTVVKQLKCLAMGFRTMQDLITVVDEQEITSFLEDGNDCLAS